MIVTSQPWENGLNWIPDPAPAASRDHGIKKSTLSLEPEKPKEKKENNPHAPRPPRLPRRLRPRLKKRTQQKHPLPMAGTTNENSPGTDLRPSWMKRTPQKHPLPAAGTTNENSPGTDLRPPAMPSCPAAQPVPWIPDTPCRLYKQARRSRVKQLNRRPRRDHFSEIPPQPEARRSLVSVLPLQLEACRGPDHRAIASASSSLRSNL